MDKETEDLITFLQEKIQAELKAATEARRLADEQAAANHLDRLQANQLSQIIEWFTDLADDVMISLHGQQVNQEIVRGFFTDLSDRLENLERSMLALLTRDVGEMRRARDLIGARLDRQQELKKLYRSLQRAREQAANYGLDVPLNLSAAIEELERKIDEIESGEE